MPFCEVENEYQQGGIRPQVVYVLSLLTRHDIHYQIIGSFDVETGTVNESTWETVLSPPATYWLVTIYQGEIRLIPVIESENGFFIYYYGRGWFYLHRNSETLTFEEFEYAVNQARYAVITLGELVERLYYNDLYLQ